MSDHLWPHGLPHTRLLCPPLFPGICSHLCPLSQWCPQPSRPLSPSSPAFSLSQHHGLFRGVGSLYQVAIEKLRVTDFLIINSLRYEWKEGPGGVLPICGFISRLAQCSHSLFHMPSKVPALSFWGRGSVPVALCIRQVWQHFMDNMLVFYCCL